MRVSGVIGVAAFALSVVAGCAEGGGGLPEVKGGIEMGVRRGAAWSTLTVRPPYIIGPRGTLKLQKGMMTGTLGDVSGPTGSIYVTIEKGGASGMGPYGPIAIDVEDDPAEINVGGMWNGARVHFRITEESFRGTIPIFNSEANRSPITRAPMPSTVATCQYVLDKVEPDGSRSGMSICGAMPEDTLLDVPRAIQGWLTRSEMVVVLLALLSAPPFTSMERRM